MKSFRRTLCLLPAVMMLISVWGCSGGGSPEGPDLDPEDMVRAMMAADTTLPEMLVRSSGEDGAQDSFFYLSGLDYNKVEAYCYAYADAGTAEEMAVVKLKSAGDAAAMMDTLHDHIEARQGTFREYDPAQVPLTENAVITREGRYVALIVSGKNGLAQKEFRKFFAAGE